MNNRPNSSWWPSYAGIKSKCAAWIPSCPAWMPKKSTVKAIFFSTGRMISSPGASNFNMTKFMMYALMVQENNPWITALGLTALAANAYVNAVTRVPAIFRTFREADPAPAALPPPATNPHQPLAQIQEEENNNLSTALIAHNDPSDAEPAEEKAEVVTTPKHPVTTKGRTAYWLLKVSGWLSGCFTSLNAYLGAVSLYLFIQHLFDPSHDPAQDELWEKSIRIGFASGISLSSFVAFYSFIIENIESVATNFGLYVENPNKTIDRHWAYAVLYCSGNILSAPFNAYFATVNTLNTIPGLNLMPEIWINGISAVSSASAAITGAANNIPSTHSFITTVGCCRSNIQEEKLDFIETPRWRFLRITTNVIGILDGIFTAAGTHNSVVNTLAKAPFNCDPYGPVVTLGLYCGTSSGFNNFTFSVRDGFRKFETDVLTRAQHKGSPHPKVDEDDFMPFDLGGVSMFVTPRPSPRPQFAIKHTAHSQIALADTPNKKAVVPNHTAHSYVALGDGAPAESTSRPASDSTSALPDLQITVTTPRGHNTTPPTFPQRVRSSSGDFRNGNHSLFKPVNSNGVNSNGYRRGSQESVHTNGLNKH